VSKFPVVMNFYILDADHHVHRVSMEVWAKWFGDIATRRVAETGIGDTCVSTVFLGINHRFIGEGPPLLFETMIFGGELDEQMWRYSSWDDAEAGHAAAVRKVLRVKHENPA